MHLLAFALIAQLAVPGQASPAVLAFPEPGLDDTAAYQGYRTRFVRDAAGNTVQIYIDGRDGRIVHLWANADNESLGLTARDARDGRAVPMSWSGDGAVTAGSDPLRILEHSIIADARHVHIGHFLLGSMRVERDFQYGGHHRAPFADAPFRLPEMERLLSAIGQLDAAEQRRHLALLQATNVATLRARLAPAIAVRTTDALWTARIRQLSLDGRDSLVLEVRADPRLVVAARAGDSLSLRARSGDRVPFTLRIATSADPLTPLAREEIFTPEFLAWLAARARDSAAPAAPAARHSSVIRARWLERQVRGVELLSSREKLMAGLPNYGTYFGRDMLVSALMMRPIWRGEMAEFVIGSVLRKLSPSGQVSHEEALGGQAVREAAAEYATLVEASRGATSAADTVAADSLLARARAVLAEHRLVRENYHMIDDEFQFPILVARWLGEPAVSSQRKRAFLRDSVASRGSHFELLLRELALVARMTAAYAADPVTANLVSFPAADSGRWASSSWRDSRAGYAGGRYAMDVNAIWVPHALSSVEQILPALRALGLDVDALARTMPELAPDTPLGGYIRDSLALRGAVDTWRDASRHFRVRLEPAEIRARVGARLNAMPLRERAFWTNRLATTRGDREPLEFLALALDADGRPIGVANSDPATWLFLGEAGATGSTTDSATVGRIRRDVNLFVRPYPVGLLIDGVGPVVANDAYASPDVWEAFVRDAYHGPRVVWGREVNLFLFGVARAIEDADSGRVASGAMSETARTAYVRELQDAIDRVTAAVEASGFQSELWSYEVDGGRVVPVRYGTGSDVQLWSTTDLAVQFLLSRLPGR